MSAINVFISVGRPHKASQEKFLIKLERLLRKKGLCPMTLGRNSYNYKAPLAPVKLLMDKCNGAIIIGFERTHYLIGYDKQGSTEEQELLHRYLSTPWNQIEAGMAFQKGIPILIMKEKHLADYGILDPKLSDYYVLNIVLEKENIEFSKELIGMLDQWTDEVLQYSKQKE